jgi:cytoskeletal protein CcmA (bactofilin family)
MFKSLTWRRAASLGLFAMLLLAVLALPFAGTARAAEIITGDPNAIVPASQVIDDDLFITGQTIRIEGTVRGDVFAAGQDVEVTGTIEGNLFVAAQFFANNGRVDGGIYTFAYVVNIGSASVVSDNVYGGAFSVETDEGSQIGRSLYVMGYQGIVSGEVGRDLNFTGAALQLNGDVGRNLTVRIGEPTEGENYEWNSWMPGNIQTIAPGFEQANDSTVGGETDYQVVDYDTNAANYAPNAPTMWGLVVAATVIIRVGEFMTLFLVGALLLLLWPAPVKRVEEQITKHPWRSLGLGVLGLILYPFAFVLAAVLIVMLGLLVGLVTLGQLAGYVFGFGFLLLGLVTLAVCFAAMVASKAIISQMVGKWLLGTFNVSLDNRWMSLLALLVGVFIFVAIRLIPVFGWLVAALVIVLGFGAMIGALWLKEPVQAARRRKAKR